MKALIKGFLPRTIEAQARICLALFNMLTGIALVRNFLTVRILPPHLT